MRTELNQEVEQLRSGDSGVMFEGEVSLEQSTDLQTSLDSIAASFDVNGFKCTECGLAHGHDTVKHQSGKAYDMSEEDTSSMTFSSVCHCGVNELARHGSDFGVSEADAARTASNAPIPDETTRRMNEMFGSP